MAEKHVDYVPEQSKKTLRRLAQQTGIEEEALTPILDYIDHVVGETALRSIRMAERVMESGKKKNFHRTKDLLVNYHKIRASVKSGTYNTNQLLEDTEFQRLMEQEESLKNQQVISVARSMAHNRVLLAQIDAGLEAMKEICAPSEDPTIRRLYPLLKSRYLDQVSVENMSELYGLARSKMYKCLDDAINMLSVILFGIDTTS